MQSKGKYKTKKRKGNRDLLKQEAKTDSSRPARTPTLKKRDSTLSIKMKSHSNKAMKYAGNNEQDWLNNQKSSYSRSYLKYKSKGGLINSKKRKKRRPRTQTKKKKGSKSISRKKKRRKPTQMMTNDTQRKPGLKTKSEIDPKQEPESSSIRLFTNKGNQNDDSNKQNRRQSHTLFRNRSSNNYFNTKHNRNHSQSNGTLKKNSFSNFQNQSGNQVNSKEGLLSKDLKIPMLPSPLTNSPSRAKGTGGELSLTFRSYAQSRVERESFERYFVRHCRKLEEEQEKLVRRLRSSKEEVREWKERFGDSVKERKKLKENADRTMSMLTGLNGLIEKVVADKRYEGREEVIKQVRMLMEIREEQYSESENEEVRRGSRKLLERLSEIFDQQIEDEAGQISMPKQENPEIEKYLEVGETKNEKICLASEELGGSSANLQSESIPDKNEIIVGENESSAGISISVGSMDFANLKKMSENSKNPSRVVRRFGKAILFQEEEDPDYYYGEGGLEDVVVKIEGVDGQKLGKMIKAKRNTRSANKQNTGSSESNGSQNSKALDKDNKIQNNIKDFIKQNENSTKNSTKIANKDNANLIPRIVEISNEDVKTNKEMTHLESNRAKMDTQERSMMTERSKKTELIDLSISYCNRILMETSPIGVIDQMKRRIERKRREKKRSENGSHQTEPRKEIKRMDMLEKMERRHMTRGGQQRDTESDLRRYEEGQQEGEKDSRDDLIEKANQTSNINETQDNSREDKDQEKRHSYGEESHVIISRRQSRNSDKAQMEKVLEHKQKEKKNPRETLKNRSKAKPKTGKRKTKAKKRKVSRSKKRRTKDRNKKMKSRKSKERKRRVPGDREKRKKGKKAAVKGEKGYKGLFNRNNSLYLRNRRKKSWLDNESTTKNKKAACVWGQIGPIPSGSRTSRENSLEMGARQKIIKTGSDPKREKVEFKELKKMAKLRPVVEPNGPSQDGSEAEERNVEARPDKLKNSNLDSSKTLIEINVSSEKSENKTPQKIITDAYSKKKETEKKSKLSVPEVEQDLNFSKLTSYSKNLSEESDENGTTYLKIRNQMQKLEDSAFLAETGQFKYDLGTNSGKDNSTSPERVREERANKQETRKELPNDFGYVEYLNDPELSPGEIDKLHSKKSSQRHLMRLISEDGMSEVKFDSKTEVETFKKKFSKILSEAKIDFESEEEEAEADPFDWKDRKFGQGFRAQMDTDSENVSFENEMNSDLTKSQNQRNFLEELIQEMSKKKDGEKGGKGDNGGKAREELKPPRSVSQPKPITPKLGSETSGDENREVFRKVLQELRSSQSLYSEGIIDNIKRHIEDFEEKQSPRGPQNLTSIRNSRMNQDKMSDLKVKTGKPSTIHPQFGNISFKNFDQATGNVIGKRFTNQITMKNLSAKVSQEDDVPAIEELQKPKPGKFNMLYLESKGEEIRELESELDEHLQNASSIHRKINDLNASLKKSKENSGILDFGLDQPEEFDDSSFVQSKHSNNPNSKNQNESNEHIFTKPNSIFANNIHLKNNDPNQKKMKNNRCRKDSLNRSSKMDKSFNRSMDTGNASLLRSKFSARTKDMNTMQRMEEMKTGALNLYIDEDLTFSQQFKSKQIVFKLDSEDSVRQSDNWSNTRAMAAEVDMESKMATNNTVNFLKLNHSANTNLDRDLDSNSSLPKVEGQFGEDIDSNDSEEIKERHRLLMENYSDTSSSESSIDLGLDIPFFKKMSTERRYSKFK